MQPKAIQRQQEQLVAELQTATHPQLFSPLFSRAKAISIAQCINRLIELQLMAKGAAPDRRE